MAGSGYDTQGEKVIPWHWPHVGDVECSGGDFKYTSHSLHNLPRLPLRILGGSRNGYHHP